jgi:hypothetical protein
MIVGMETGLSTFIERATGGNSVCTAVKAKSLGWSPSGAHF